MSSARRVRLAGISIAVVVGLGLIAWCPGRPPPAQAPPSEVADAPHPDGEPGLAAQPSSPRPAARSPSRPTNSKSAASPWRVRVLGPGDRPLGGVRILRVGAESEFVETDEEGNSRLTWGETEKKLNVRISGAGPSTATWLTRRDSVLRFPELVALEVEVLDGSTGYFLPGSRVALRRPHAPLLPIPLGGDSFTIPVSPLRHGNLEFVDMHIEVPLGYVMEAAGKARRVVGTVSRFAKRAIITYVAWPFARVRVRVLEADGRRVAGARIGSARLVGGNAYEFQAGPTDSGGETLIRGVPWLRGESLSVSVGFEGRSAFGQSLLKGLGDECLVVAVLPPERDINMNGSIGIGGGAGGAFRGRAGSRVLLSTSTSGRVEVKVIRRNGTPAAGARLAVRTEKGAVHWGRTDNDGLATFTRIPVGPAKVAVREAGFVMEGAVCILIRQGKTAEVTITEAAGRTLFVFVTDGEDVPVPFAEISVAKVAGVPYSYLVGDIQRLRIFTDLDGRAVLPGFPPGAVMVTAKFGTRRASAKAAEGGMLHLILHR